MRFCGGMLSGGIVYSILFFLEAYMKSFKEYAKESGERVEDAQTAEELAKKISSAFHGKSDAEMLKNILYEAEKSKRAGTLSNEEIEAFYQSFSPMLDGMQRRYLRTVVDRLKRI